MCLLLWGNVAWWLTLVGVWLLVSVCASSGSSTLLAATWSAQAADKERDHTLHFATNTTHIYTIFKYCKSILQLWTSGTHTYIYLSLITCLWQWLCRAWRITFTLLRRFLSCHLLAAFPSYSCILLVLNIYVYIYTFVSAYHIFHKICFCTLSWVLSAVLCFRLDC